MIKLSADNKMFDSSPLKYAVTQGEKAAETVEFEISRFYSDYSMENCTFIIKGVNSAGNKIEKTLSKNVLENTVVLTWSIDEDFTAVAGPLELEIRGVIQVLSEEILLVKFGMQPIEIKSSPDGSGTPETNLIEQAMNSFHITVDEGKTTIQNFINQQIADLGYPYIILTQTEYDALASPLENKLYVITGD